MASQALQGVCALGLHPSVENFASALNASSASAHAPERTKLPFAARLLEGRSGRYGRSGVVLSVVLSLAVAVVLSVALARACVTILLIPCNDSSPRRYHIKSQRSNIYRPASIVCVRFSGKQCTAASRNKQSGGLLCSRRCAQCTTPFSRPPVTETALC